MTTIDKAKALGYLPGEDGPVDEWLAEYATTMTGLPSELIAKMEAAKTATDKPCPVCRVGRGKFCTDVTYAVTIDGVHPQRKVWAEADDLTRTAFLLR